MLLISIVESRERDQHPCNELFAMQSQTVPSPWIGRHVNWNECQTAAVELWPYIQRVLLGGYVIWTGNFL